MHIRALITSRKLCGETDYTYVCVWGCVLIRNCGSVWSFACVCFRMCMDVWACVHAPPEISLKGLNLIQAGKGRAEAIEERWTCFTNLTHSSYQFDHDLLLYSAAYYNIVCACWYPPRDNCKGASRWNRAHSALMSSKRFHLVVCCWPEPKVKPDLMHYTRI